MIQKILTFISLSFLSVMSLFGQEIQVSGKVTDAFDGSSLPGVNILIVGTSNGSQTDLDGNYQLNVPVGSVLRFSYIGMITKDVNVEGSTTINVQLEVDFQHLEAVIVTAFGIEKETKTLSYAAQDIRGDELTRVKDVNPINNLSGKVAGLAVNRSASGSGGSVKVTIRGNSSTRNNQPLYVIDGVPILNNSAAQPNKVFGDLAGGNRDGGDAVSLINPNDVESISVLKGASASALYGSQGANGVILITTKKGHEGRTTINISSNSTFESLINLPNFQTEYAAAPDSEVSWGAKNNVADHVDDFFRGGFMQITSASLSSGTEKAQTYLSYASTRVKGVMPTNRLAKHNLNLRETAKFFNDKLSVDASISLTSQKIINKPVNGFYFNPLTGLYLFPRGNDFGEFKNNFEVFDTDRNLLKQNWLTDRDIEQNPYWILNKNKSEDQNLRAVVSTSLNFQINDWLNLRSRISYDKLFNTYEKKIHATTQTTLSHVNGRYILVESDNTQLYADLILAFNKPVSENLELIANLGTSVTNYKIDDRLTLDSGVSSGLELANWFTASNFKGTTDISQTLGSNSEIQSIFGNVQIGYKGILYADITGRKDWSSTLVKTDNLSFFYPSIGLSGVISEMLELPEFVDFGKVRVSYAEVGNDIPSFITSPRNTIAGGTVSGPLIGPRPGESLKPEKQKSFEFGAEWKFLKNRLNFEFTYYNTNTENQYILVPAPPTNPFGYENYAFNAGSIKNRGIEVILSARPIEKEELFWTTAINFASNKNEVKDLPEELGGRVVLTEPGVNHYRYALEEGQPFGLIQGKKLVRDDQGRIQLDADGNLQVGDFETVGNANPDFILGWSNTFEYKNFSLNILLDGRFGGEVMSITEAMNDEFGVSQKTADARNAGGVAINAVNADNTPFTGLYDAQSYYTKIGGRAGATGEYIYDATNISFRELSLGYKFNLDDHSFIRAANISLVGRNLFFISKKAPFDPNISLSTGEGLQGVDVFGQPAIRSIGLNVNLTF